MVSHRSRRVEDTSGPRQGTEGRTSGAPSGHQQRIGRDTGRHRPASTSAITVTTPAPAATRGHPAGHVESVLTFTSGPPFSVRAARLNALDDPAVHDERSRWHTENRSCMPSCIPLRNMSTLSTEPG